MTERDAFRFWAKVSPQEAGCWVWTAGTGGKRSPYGMFKLGGKKQVISSRYAFEMCVGPIPPQMLVCHKCDNPKCVNPSHLFLGTGSDNAMDSVRKGRHWSSGMTHCKRGHPFIIENLSPSHLSRGHKLCLLCNRMHSRKHYQKINAGRVVAPRKRDDTGRFA